MLLFEYFKLPGNCHERKEGASSSLSKTVSRSRVTFIAIERRLDPPFGKGATHVRYIPSVIAFSYCTIVISDGGGEKAPPSLFLLLLLSFDGNYNGGHVWEIDVVPASLAPLSFHASEKGPARQSSTCSRASDSSLFTTKGNKNVHLHRLRQVRGDLHHQDRSLAGRGEA